MPLHCSKQPSVVVVSDDSILLTRKLTVNKVKQLAQTEEFHFDAWLFNLNARVPAVQVCCLTT